MPPATNDEEVKFFQENLLNWYKENGRQYYWRKSNLSHYKYVIAEVLLQRTRADTVAQFYPSFIKQYPNWHSLAQAALSSVAEYLRPLGLHNQRAARLKSLALEMVKRKGALPRERGELESIPFMGQYMANAVELVIFNQPSPLVDVNMARVLERFFEPRKMADIRYDPYLQKLSRKIVAHKEHKKINWSILDFAALICTARNPKHAECPINKSCAFYQGISKSAKPNLK